MRPPMYPPTPTLGDENGRNGSFVTLVYGNDSSEHAPRLSHSNKSATYSAPPFRTTTLPAMNGSSATTIAAAATIRRSVELDQSATHVVLSPTQKRIGYSPTKKRNVYTPPSLSRPTVPGSAPTGGVANGPSASGLPFIPGLSTPAQQTVNSFASLPKPQASLSPYKPPKAQSWLVPNGLVMNGIYTKSIHKAPNRLNAYSFIWLLIAFGIMLVAGATVYWSSTSYSSSSLRLRNGLIRETTLASNLEATPHFEEEVPENEPLYVDPSKEQPNAKKSVQLGRSKRAAAPTPTTERVATLSAESFEEDTDQSDSVPNQDPVAKYKLKKEKQRDRKRKRAETTGLKDSQKIEVASQANPPDEQSSENAVKSQENESETGKVSRKEADSDRSFPHDNAGGVSALDFAHFVMSQSRAEEDIPPSTDTTSNTEQSNRVQETGRTTDIETKYKLMRQMQRDKKRNQAEAEAMRDSSKKFGTASDNAPGEQSNEQGVFLQKPHDSTINKVTSDANDADKQGTIEAVTTLDFDHHVLNRSPVDDVSANKEDRTIKIDGRITDPVIPMNVFARTVTTEEGAKKEKNFRHDAIVRKAQSVFTPRTAMSSDEIQLMSEGRLVSRDQAKNPRQGKHATEVLPTKSQLSSEELSAKERSRVLQHARAAAGPRRASS